MLSPGNHRATSPWAELIRRRCSQHAKWSSSLMWRYACTGLSLLEKIRVKYICCYNVRFFLNCLVFKFSIEKKLAFELKSDSFPSTQFFLFNWPLFSATLKEKKEIALKYSFQLSQTMVGFSFPLLFLRSAWNFLTSLIIVILAILFQGNAVHSTWCRNK